MLYHRFKKIRPTSLNFKLGCFMSAIAGAINAGGFLAIGQYTSHVTGHLSRMADNIVLGDWHVAVTALGMMSSFLAGSIISSMFVIYYKHMKLRSCYAVPVFFEIIWLLVFGYLGDLSRLHQDASLIYEITFLLCFIMGIHNSIISKISNAEIKTTHMTGIVTDIGIELAQRLMFKTFPQDVSNSVKNRIKNKLKIHATIFLYFVAGSIAGAFSFKYLGYITVLILSAMMISLTIKPIIKDIEIRKRWYRWQTI